jgi:hypothetical protein
MLGGDLGVVGDQRLVTGLVDDQLMPEALGVLEPHPVAVALGRDVDSREALGPKVERIG